MPASSIYLALGTNLGDREDNLSQGLLALLGRGVRLRAQSSLYETEPVGGPAQGDYLNQVVEGETDLGAEELLTACLGAERELGRLRGEKDGPRSIDIDLLLYGAETADSGFLTLPHPRLHERRFVLVPLAEIAPHARHPRLGLTVAELLLRCPDTSRVSKYQGVKKDRA